MNPFLLAFAGALTALLLVAVLVYTYIMAKLRPLFERMQQAGILPSTPEMADMSRGAETDAFGSGFDVGKLAGARLESIEYAMRSGSRAMLIPQPEDLEPPADQDDKDRRQWERGVIDALNGHGPAAPAGHAVSCPMCGAEAAPRPDAA